MNIVLNILIGMAMLGVGGYIGYKEIYKRKNISFEKRKEKAEEIITEAKKIAEETIQTAKTRIEGLKENAEKNHDMTKRLIAQMEKSTNTKEQLLKKQEEKVNELRLKIASIEEELSVKEKQLRDGEGKEKEILSQKAGKKEEELKKEILKKYETDLEQDYKQRVINIVEEAKEKAPRLAQRIIVNVIQRLTSPTSVEQRAVNVTVPKDIIKGKIVGKGATNILYFEELLDVDVVFNDLPNTISISAFNLVNRRIAQKALEKLIKYPKDINQKVIDEVVNRSKQETEEELYEIGKKVLEEIGVKVDNKELTTIIGRLQYRTSYSQNIMRHSMEVCYLATMLGAEIGANTETCKIGGFLHDLGKAIDQNPDVQGTHDFLTKELMEKYGFSPEEIHAAWTHHESEKPATAEALLVQAADALSASRPGARQESIEKYIARLQALEGVAYSFEGIKKAFAISGGREVRVIVDPTVVDDAKTQNLADTIAKKVEEDVTYPGKIKINVIRKTKTIEVAK